MKLISTTVDRARAGFRLSKTLGALTLLTTVGITLFAAFTTKTLHDDAWERAESSARNVLRLIEQDIARNVELFDLSLDGVRYGTRLPGFATLTTAQRHAILFDRSATARYLGSLMVIDRDGNVVHDSRSFEPRKDNFASRDYFLHHAETVDPGLYVSKPYLSYRTGNYDVGFSRRWTDETGGFAGVIVGTMQLDYFAQMFAKLDVGPRGSVTLLRTDGTILMRSPDGNRAVGTTVAKGDTFEHYASRRFGSVMAASAVDGVERLYSFSRISDLPLILSVGLSTQDIFAEWWRKAAAIAAVVACLVAVTFTLNILLLRELRRREAAESSLKAANDALSRQAVTDPLTALGNRRHFDDCLRREWARARKLDGRLGLVMIDADYFKAYNDRYGHAGGDAVLRAVADDLRATHPHGPCMPCRIGGEEFALVTRGDLATAFDLAEAVRAAVRARATPHEGSPHGIVTVSVGVASLTPTSGLKAEALIRAADEALYRAKAGGRDRTAMPPDIAPDAATPVSATERRTLRSA